MPDGTDPIDPRDRQCNYFYRPTYHGRCKHEARVNGMCLMHWNRGLRVTAKNHYAKSLPVQLAERYEANFSDPDLLSMRSEVALVKVRLEDLVSRLRSRESGDWRRKSIETLDAMFATLQSPKATPEEKAAAVKAHRDHLQAGAADEQTWEDILGTMRSYSAIVGQETGRLHQARQLMTVEQAMILVAHVVGIVKLKVSDPVVVHEIADGIARILEVQDVPEAREMSRQLKSG